MHRSTQSLAETERITFKSTLCRYVHQEARTRMIILASTTPAKTQKPAKCPADKTRHSPTMGYDGVPHRLSPPRRYRHPIPGLPLQYQGWMVLCSGWRPSDTEERHSRSPPTRCQQRPQPQVRTTQASPDTTQGVPGWGWGGGGWGQKPPPPVEN